MTLSLVYQEGETDALVNLEEEEDAHIAYSDLGQGSKLLQRAWTLDELDVKLHVFSYP